MSDHYQFSIAMVLDGSWENTQKCLASLLRQTFDAPIEIFLIETQQQRLSQLTIKNIFINSSLYHQGKISLHYLSHSLQTNLYAKINQAIAAAKGEWFYCLSSENLLLDDFFSRLGEIITENKFLDIISCAFLEINQRDEMVKRSELLTQSGITSQAFLNHWLTDNLVPLQTTLVRRVILQGIECFDESLGTGHSWELWRRLITIPDLQWYYLPEYLTCYRRQKPDESWQDLQNKIGDRPLWDIFQKARVYHSLKQQKTTHRHYYQKRFQQIEEALLIQKVDLAFDLILNLVKYSGMGDRLWSEVLNKSTLKHKQQIYEMVLLLLHQLESQVA